MIRSALLRWSIFAVMAGVWEAGTRAVDDAYFTPPSKIMTHMTDLWFSGPLTRLFLTHAATENLLPSLVRMFSGLALSCTIGMAIGLAVGRSQRAFAFFDPILQFGRFIPPPTLVPIFIVLLGIGPRMQIAAIALSGLWPIILNTAEGARAADPMQIDTARVYRFTAWERLRFVIVPAALPKIFAGLRLSLALALILMVFSELQPGATNGLGYTLTNAQSSFDLPTMWAGIVLLGILGYLLNTLLLILERRMLSWHRAQRTA
jgi:ABC-type nitrate/sulfonate/bicarbonate transport system permease component